MELYPLKKTAAKNMSGNLDMPDEREDVRN